jgi:hypothetical protein
MDDRRFDSLTRSVASGLERRGALKAVLAAAIAAAAIGPSLRRVLADTCSDCGGDCTARGNTCGSTEECCGTDVCLFAECVPCLTKGDDSCRRGQGDCCPGLSCRDDGPKVSCQPDKNPGKSHGKHKKKGKGKGKGKGR